MGSRMALGLLSGVQNKIISGDAPVSDVSPKPSDVDLTRQRGISDDLIKR